MGYQVKLEVFEGPFDLLLNLISKQKIDIYDIPIAKITDEYLSYLEEIEELDLEVATEFLLVAATLLQIKAASLLPEESEWIEETSLDETRELLVARLIEYKRFKNIAAELEARFEVESNFYHREVVLEDRFTRLLPDFLESVQLDDLRRIYLALGSRKSISLRDAEYIAPEPINIDDYIGMLAQKLRAEGRKTFRELTSDCEGKSEIIAAFVALLEMYKRREIKLGQAETFGEIVVTLCNPTVASSTGGG